MKKSVIFSSMLVAGMTAGVSHAQSLEMALLQEAIISGKTNLDLRLRGEWVDDTVRKEAFDQTLRTVLGYKTGDYHGIKSFVEFENVSDFGKDDYTAGVPTKPTQYAQVPDPEVSQINQVGAEAYGFKVGRQKIIVDNARFIGDVGWRQNDQTFDAATYTNSTLVPDLTVMAGYAYRVNRPDATHRRIEMPMASVRYTHFPAAKFGLFYYAVDDGSTKALAATSWQQGGAKLDGTIGDFLYEASYAKQDDYSDGTVASSPEADYTDFQVGYKLGPVTVKAQHETLEMGFKTPFATLHAFNGWVDMFTTTPTKGLEDSNLKILSKLGDVSLTLAGHYFKAEEGRAEFGSEVDFSALYQYSKNLSFLAKYGKYEAKDVVALTGTTPNNKDREKGWVQMQFKF